MVHLPGTVVFAPVRWTASRFTLQQFSIAWRDFVLSTDKWMNVTELQGEAAIQQTFNQVLSGSAPPSNAYVLSF